MSLRNIPGTPFRSLESVYKYGISQFYSNNNMSDLDRFKTWFKGLNDIVGYRMRDETSDDFIGYRPKTEEDNTTVKVIGKSDIWMLLLNELIQYKKVCVPIQNNYLSHVLRTVLEYRSSKMNIWRDFIFNTIYSQEFYEYLDDILNIKDHKNKMETILHFAASRNIIQTKFIVDKTNVAKIRAVANIKGQDYNGEFLMTDLCRSCLKYMESPSIMGNLLRFVYFDFMIFNGIENEKLKVQVLSSEVAQSGYDDTRLLIKSPVSQLVAIQEYVFEMGDYDRDSNNLYSSEYSAVKEDNDQKVASVVDMLKNGTIDNIVTYLISNKSRLLDYDLTPNNYYSGNDAYIFFNGERAGEVTYIDWTLEEKTKPIYGYASYTWDEIAKGQRIVTGRISINFIKTNYVNALLQTVQENAKADSNNLSIFNALKNKTLEEKKKIIEDTINNANEATILELAERMDELLWGYDTGGNFIDRYHQPYFNNPTPNINTGMAPNIQGFDVVIAWGNELFKIAGLGADGSETVTVINDVHLISESQKVEIGAQNIQTVYEFVARDLNNSLVTEQDRINLYSGN